MKFESLWNDSANSYNKLIMFLTRNGFKNKEIKQFINLLNDYDNKYKIMYTYLSSQEK